VTTLDVGTVRVAVCITVEIEVVKMVCRIVAVSESVVLTVTGILNVEVAGITEVTITTVVGA
jgi:hypothetical protein